MKYELRIKNKLSKLVDLSSTIFWRSKSSAGFTIIEIMVALFGFIVLSVGLVALISNVFLSSTRSSNLLVDSDSARKLSFQIMSELRNASLSSVGAYSLDTASAQTIVFYSNIDKDAYIEKIRYFLQNGKLYKGVIKPTGNPLSYSSSNEAINLVQDNIANATSPLFYYYDGSFSGTQSSLVQPVNVTAVKSVKVDIKIFNKAGVTNSNFYIVTASGTIRNLKTNLGE